MSRRIGSASEEQLIHAPLPEYEGDTYTVISHEFVIAQTKASLKDNSLLIDRAIYKGSTGMQVATGVYELQFKTDPDISMMFAFANSYNKTLRFRCAVGSYVLASHNYIISNMDCWNRKHTGDADVQVRQTICSQLEHASDFYGAIIEDKIKMTNITVTKKDFARLLGELYFHEHLLTAEQIGIINAELKKSEIDYGYAPDTLWVNYNHILTSLQTSHPKYWMDQQRLIHLHILEHFNLESKDLSMNHEPPNQLKLELPYDTN